MQRWPLVVGAVLLLGVGAFARTMTSATLPLAPLPAFTEPTARPPAGMKLSAIRTGNMQAKAAFAFRGGTFDDDRSFVIGAILVQHPLGTLLFDAGFGRNVDAHIQTAPYLMRKLTTYTKGTPAVDQLRRAGVDPSTLTGIVLTHAHWDHASGLDDFRDVPVLVTQDELDFVHSGDLATDLIRSFGNLRYKTYGFPGGPYLGFEASYDFFGDGSVVLVKAGGHTPGSVIAFVTLPEGRRYALVGDIVWQREGVERPAERPWLSRRLADKDEETVRTIVVRLHQLKERFPDLVIVPAHDDRVWSTLPALK